MRLGRKNWRESNSEIQKFINTTHDRDRRRSAIAPRPAIEARVRSERGTLGRWRSDLAKSTFGRRRSTPIDDPPRARRRGFIRASRNRGPPQGLPCTFAPTHRHPIPVRKPASTRPLRRGTPCRLHRRHSRYTALRSQRGRRENTRFSRQRPCRPTRRCRGESPPYTRACSGSKPHRGRCTRRSCCSPHRRRTSLRCQTSRRKLQTPKA